MSAPPGLPDALGDLPDLPPAEAERRVLAFVLERLAEFLQLESADDLDPGATFLDYGFDSLRAVEFKDLLAAALGCELRTTLAFDYPTPAQVSGHLVSEVLGLGPGTSAAPNEVPPEAGEEPMDLDSLDPAELRSLLEVRSARLRALEERLHEPIAVVGIACRFPGGATDPEAFWRLQRDAVDAIREIPAERFPIDRFYDADPSAKGKIATRYGGFLEDIDLFDARFFGMSAREAVELDPRQRLFLETTWETLESGGQSADDLRGRSVGVFLGILSHEYFDSQTDRNPEQIGAYAATGSALSTAAGRVAYTLGWTGPAIALDTACSSSLVAVHLGVQSIRRGECEAALVGGVNLLLDEISTISISQASMLAPDGRCKTFDARGDGYVRSEGVGAALLKPLSRALADGDRIFAVVRGTASNQDGASSGLTVPNGPSQEAVLRAALEDGRVDPADVSYIEAHGTGTSLGDPIEVGALDAVFGPGRPAGTPLWCGSVKTNIGHSEPSAGIAGFLKLVLALQHEELPPNLHFETPNPHIDWDRSIVRVPTARVPWARGDRPRTCGVSSFGFSGTNAHVVLEEAPAPQPSPVPGADDAPPVDLLVVSAHDDAALQTRLEDLRDLAAAEDAPDWHDLCHTAAVGRAHHPRRLALVAAGPEDLARSLREAVRDPSLGVRGQAGPRAPRVAFLFTGQGSQAAGMGRELYGSEPVFRATLDRCAAVLDPLLGTPLTSVLWGADTALLDQTRYTQPALFALEYALAQTWRAWGIEPVRVLGHSVGEVVAACVAGILELEDALRLIEARGRLMTELTEPGAMLVVFAPQEDVAPQLARFPGRVDLAAVNGPANVVISGATEAIEAIERDLAARNVTHQRLTVSHAFHSPAMEPMLAAYGEVADTLAFHPPNIPLVSCLDPGGAGTMTTAAEWVRHVRAPVRFRDAMAQLVGDGTACDVLLEIGPSPVLLGMARRFLRTEDTAWLPSLRPGQGDRAALLASLAELYAQGADVTWSAVRAGLGGRRVGLPTYPFQRERYWYERRLSRPGVAEVASGDGGWHPLLGRRLPAAVLGEDQSLFQAAVADDAPSYLTDHRVFEAAIVPAAAFLEIGFAAGARELGGGRLRLEGVAIREPLAVDADRTALQTLLEPSDDGAWSFRIHSLVPATDESETDAWVLHASGRVRSEDREISPPKALDTLRRGAWEERDVADVYAAYDEIGLHYGPAFQAIRELKRRRGEVLARVRLADELAESGEEQLHPVLLDACFQTAAAAIFEASFDDLYLPVGMDAVRCLRRPEGEVWVHTSVREEDAAPAHRGPARSHRIDMVIYEAKTGEPVAAVEALQLVLADRSALARADDALRGLLHEVAWQPGPARDEETPVLEPGGWVLVSGPTELAGSLTEALEEHGHRVVRVEPGDDASGSLEGLAPLRGAIHLASLEEGDLERALASALGLTQTLVKAGAASPTLALVTRGAQQTGDDRALRPEGATLWGLGHTVAVEHPDLATLRIDLDPRGAAASDEAAFLAEELHRPDGEDRIALRTSGAGRTRLVARLTRSGTEAAGGLTPPEADAWHLRTPSYGVLDNLQLLPLERRAPGPGEVEVEVRAAGLNFKDVLHTLGMLREFSEAQGILEAKDQPLGFECAGTVVRVGEGVTRLSVGDEVLASTTNGCFATHVTAPADVVFRKPANLSMVDAAAVQTVFLTAIYGLERCARLQEGERVLIHACAGGVGQAALQLAQARGCEVFATASRGKWGFLQGQGVQHVLDSRSLEFADEVLRITEGKGVDVVLNSLAGDYVEASLRSLGEGGRFVEIGKLDTWEPERMAAERPDVSYFRFDLSETSEQDPHRPTVTIQELQADMAAGFHEGSLHAMPVKEFRIQQALGAFRHLAQAKNIGKVVLTFPAAGDTGDDEVRVRPDRSYLVTGGLGALGLVVARRLIDAGARTLILVGRRGLEGADEDVRTALEEFRAGGVHVEAASLDVADRAACAALLDRIADGSLARGAPLAGVVHAAGVLDDGMIVNQEWARFRSVLAPKVDGARHLHELTADRSLDFFVLFSSMAALLGSPGQASYAAGNAYMDALAEARRAAGLRALSVNWGPWSGGGMAASLASRNQVRFAEMGLRSLSPERGGEVFDRLLATRVGHVAVLPIQWSKYLRRRGAGGPPPFLEQFAVARAEDPGAGAAVIADLERAAPENREHVLADFVERQLAQVLGFGSSASLDRDRSFGELGVDSLLAVDLRNRLESSLGVSLPATLLFDFPNFELLVQELARRVLPGLSRPGAGDGAKPEPARAAEDEVRRATLAELEELSEDEIAQRLAAQIEAMSDGEEA